MATEQTVEEGYIIDEEGRLVPDYDSTITVFDEGDIVKGEIVRIDRDEVLVDIGYKSEGVIPLKELSIRQDLDPSELVDLGDSIDALVLQKEDADGRLILSKKRAQYEASWRRIEEMSEKGETVEGDVIEVVKGGLILDIGLRGFLPASLVDLRRVRDLQEFMGEKLECKVIEMDRNRNNVVLSRRAVLESERREQREAILGRLEKGVKVEGKISSIVAFGAFVDLDGIDGLIHISELSWDHVEHPSQVVSVGEEVEVLVLDVDEERQRVSLGLRQTRQDPWKEAVTHFNPGDKVDGSVAKLVPFGAFIDIGHGVEGLIHISEFAEEHVAQPEDMLKKGDAVTVKVIDIDPERRRVSLSLRQAAEGYVEKEESDDDSADESEEATPEASAEGEAEAEAPAEESSDEPESEPEAEDVPDLISGELPAADEKTEKESEED